MKPSDEHSASVLLYLDGEFSGHELEDFLAHLANCVDCTMSLEEERRSLSSCAGHVRRILLRRRFACVCFRSWCRAPTHTTMRQIICADV
jgi:hypothetical protein